MGIRLYYLLRALYEANQKLDASCCSILFCKAMELQMQECFGNSLKRLLPDAKMSGRGTLGKTEISRLTLGNFHFLIGKNSGMLAARMAERGESRYDADWWRQYETRLKKCAGQRNQCCHSGLFTWQDQKILIQEIFREENAREEKMKGLLFEAEVGRRLS